MTKTAEELYEERVTTLTRGFVLDYFDGGIGDVSVSDFLFDNGVDDADLHTDVSERVNEALDTMIQRWLDD